MARVNGETSASSAPLRTMAFDGNFADDNYLFESLTDVEYGQLEEGMCMSE